MTLKTASPVRSPCELLRMINDLVQGDTENDLMIRRLVSECESKTKRLGKELNKYKKDVWRNWWEKKSTFKEDFKKRNSDGYKVEKYDTNVH